MTKLGLLLKTLVTTAALALAQPAIAQSQFDPAIVVDDSAITPFEIQQRIAMLRVFRTPGNLEDVARQQLIEDRLKLDAIARAGLRLSDDSLQAELEAFAGRANLSYDQFLTVLTQNGVAEETLRDFVRVGVSWRDFVRSRFGDRAQISDRDVDQALGQGGGTGTGIEVLLSEIIIPAPPPQAAQAQATAERISRLTSFSAFEAEARRVSALPSRNQGGRLGWLPISNYPAALRSILLDLAPGEVTAPIPITNGIALFQLRDVREVRRPQPSPAAIEYAAFYIPGGRNALAEAQQIEARVDTCDDLYGVAKGLPEERLERGSRTPAEIPQDVALELAKLDPGEVSYNLTRADGQTLVFLMMCGRTAALDGDQDREAVRAQLRSQRLAGFADALLEELRAQATIRVLE